MQHFKQPKTPRHAPLRSSPYTPKDPTTPTGYCNTTSLSRCAPPARSCPQPRNRHQPRPTIPTAPTTHQRPAELLYPLRQLAVVLAAANGLENVGPGGSRVKAMPMYAFTNTNTLRHWQGFRACSARRLPALGVQATVPYADAGCEKAAAPHQPRPAKRQPSPPPCPAACAALRLTLPPDPYPARSLRALPPAQAWPHRILAPAPAPPVACAESSADLTQPCHVPRATRATQFVPPAPAPTTLAHPRPIPDPDMGPAPSPGPTC